MIIVTGNHSKSKIVLDTPFDCLLLENTVTHEKRELVDLEPYYRGGLYYRLLIDFSEWETGEYSYIAKLGDKIVQRGLLIIEPFDESEAQVQKITPELERKVITYTKK